MSRTVFIDSRVPDLGHLVAGLGADDQVFLVDPTHDGIAKRLTGGWGSNAN